LDLRQVKYDATELLHDYVHALDDGRYEDWIDFFTDSANYRIVARDNFEQNLPLSTMFCEGQGMMRDRVTAIREALVFAPNYLRHVVSALRITGHADDRHRVEANYVVFSTAHDQETRVFNAGKYFDEIVYVDGQAKYASKLVVYDSLIIPGLLAIPL
jgi:anthranilate 1,2-dioxygenase small subunit